MNDTLWWDDLDGDNLVCRPGNESEKAFSLACLLFTRIMPIFFVCLGIYLLYMGRLRHKLTSSVQADNDPTNNSRATTFVTSRKTNRKPAQNGNRGTVLLVIGLNSLTLSLAMIINGQGTAFASNTVRGRIGDAFYAIHFGTTWYFALIQVRGAKLFQGLVELPTGTQNASQNKRWFNWLSPNQFLDLLQERCAPVVAFLLWLLLATGVLSRGWFYFFGHISTAIFGLRAFVGVATKRVSALRKMASIQNAVHGTAEDKKRRKGTLFDKVFDMIIELIATFVVGVLPHSSIVMLGSTFSSRQFVVHYAIMFPIMSFAALLLMATIYRGIIREKKRVKGRRRNNRVDEIGAASQVSGLSVLEQSVLAIDDKDRLFSAISSST